MANWIRQLSWPLLILLCIMPGLAPFSPPHLFEKIPMLFQGQLNRPMDMFDLFFHGAPWLAALTKLGLSLGGRK